MKTAECVSKGHPDKMCDQISDAILDACLRQDPNSRVAIETMGGHGEICIMGELTTKAKINAMEIASDVVNSIGYDASKFTLHENIVKQSPDISMGVDNGGAGDQGIMVGYACDGNTAMIPNELFIARDIIRRIPLTGFGPDAKSQVTVDMDGRIDSIVISAQHKQGQGFSLLRDLARSYSSDCKIYINPTGQFIQGGFTADTGLTGRKLAVDNYGPQIPIGGGAFSGKDPSKVDRSAAYMARRIAVDILRSNHAQEVMVKLAYSIGVAHPVMANAIVMYKSGRIEEIDLLTLDGMKYDLTPAGIINFLDLKKPIYQKTAEFGHFGNGFNWDN